MQLRVEIRSRYDLAERLWGQGKANFLSLCEEFPITNGKDNLMDYLDSYISDIYDDGCNDVELNDFLWFDFDTIEKDRKEQY